MNRFCFLLLLVSLKLIVPLDAAESAVDAATMQRTYEEVKTPFKYGVILKDESPDELVDCPGVFRHGDHWYIRLYRGENVISH